MRAFFLFIAIGTIAVPSFAAEPKPTLRAGAFAMDVSPLHFPISVNGNFSDIKATAVHDPLNARCIVLDDGKIKLAIVIVDNCLMPRELIDDAKTRASAKTGIPVGHMLVSATHTHTAPAVTACFGSNPDAKYVEFLTGKIAEGIEKANANLTECELGWGVAQEPTQLFNRRWWIKPGMPNLDPFGNTTDLVRMNPGQLNPGLISPAGPIDPDVSVLSARTVSGQPMALYTNYSLHYVGGYPAVSADYFGVVCEKLGSMIGGDAKFVGALSNGTSGDVNNVNFGQSPIKAGPGERIRVVGEVVATAAKKAYLSAKHTREVSFAVAERELEFAVRKPTAAEVTRAESILKKIAGRNAAGADEVYAGETIAINKYPDKVKLKLQVMRIGDLAITAIPCEVFTEIGLEIKRRSPIQPTLNVSLANGYNGYLPTPHQHHLGGYETWRARSSYLEVNASVGIVKTVLELLNEVAKK